MVPVPCVFKKDINGICYDEVETGFEWALAGNVLVSKKAEGEIVKILAGKVYKADDSAAQWYVPEDVIYADALELLKKERSSIPNRYYILSAASLAGGRGGVKTATLTPYVGIAGQPVDIGIHRGWTEISFLSKQLKLSFSLLKSLCELPLMPGFVFHHTDGRVCEVTRADFGLPLSLPGEFPAPEQIGV